MSEGGEVRIIQLPKERWQEYKALRLEAVQQDPPAFGRSYEETLEMAEEKWITYLGPEEGPTGMLFAEVDGKLVGMIGSIQEGPERLAHRALIVSMYVTPLFRGKGIARKLLEAMIEKISKHPHIVAIDLNVTVGQDAAEKLYRSMGFEEVGVSKREMKIGDTFYDTIIMAKDIR